MPQLSQQTGMRQQMALIPRLQQSVKLLQMSTVEFHQEVALALSSNPFLEEPEENRPDLQPVDIPSADADAPRPEHRSASPDDGNSSSAQLDSQPESHEDNATTAPEVNEVSGSAAPPGDPEDSWSGNYPQPQSPGLFGLDAGNREDHRLTLADVLRDDLFSYKLNPRDHALVELIIEALDENGYLRVPFNELMQHDETWAPETQEWEIALRLVQQMASPGIGARNLAECLRLQLNALPEDTAYRALAIEIVNDGLESLAKHDFGGLARRFCASKADAIAAADLIRSLDPRPASRYASLDPCHYVIPDARVRKAGRKWVVHLCEESVPRAQLHVRYARMFRESQCVDRSLMANALQEARWLLRSIEQRASTMEKVAQVIVAHQQAFFQYGDVALQPLMLSEIAEELGMHESTVSRATSNKYLICPRGIYSFKHFFQRELATSTGGSCSSGAVRALIREMIDAEHPSRPLSDVSLTAQLADQGVVVARRTVTKYRAQINIPPVEQRRAPVAC